jgi:OOP family OmpA-OmpF porin
MKKQIFAALVGLSISAAASAQGYGVASVGIARLSVDCSGTSSCDKSDTAFKLLGGYKFTPNVAVEAGYFSFGKATAAASGVNVGIKNTAVGGGVAFHQDLGSDWNAVARIGVAQVRTTIDASVSGAGSGSDTDSNAALYGGVGIGYKLTKMTSVDAVWDFSKSKYNKNGIDESGSINAFSVGVTFSF